MRDATPRVRRAGYLLYVLGQTLEEAKDNLDLKSDPILSIISHKGMPLVQIIFNDYADVPSLKFNRNSTISFDNDRIKLAFLEKLGIQEPDWG